MLNFKIKKKNMKLYSRLFYFILCMTYLYLVKTIYTNTSNYQNENNENTKLLFKKNEIPNILKTFYHTNDIYKFIDDLHSENSGFVEILTIGHTIQGTPLKIIIIKPNSSNYSDIMWIDGGTHAREWITVSSVIYIVNELIRERHNLPTFMKNITFVLMPIVNPDGYSYSHEKDRFWRKNVAETNNNCCVGIDLNRNWDFDWSSIYSDENTCSETYRGSFPNSELEIRAIIKFVMKNVTKIKGFITLHSYGQVILYPWAYTKDKLTDSKELHTIATAMSLKIFEKTSKMYTVGSASSLMYIVSGSALDWMKGIANIKYVFTLELRDTGHYGFNLPISEIIPTGKEAFYAVSVLAKHIGLRHRSKNQIDKSRCNMYKPIHLLFYILFVICFYSMVIL